MSAAAASVKPKLGMILAFQQTPAEPLAGIPAQVIYIWPRFRSGDYLVTLEYPAPVKTKEGLIAHIDAFLSELCPVVRGRPAWSGSPARDTTT
jgi:hypothetical protein